MRPWSSQEIAIGVSIIGSLATTSAWKPGGSLKVFSSSCGVSSARRRQREMDLRIHRPAARALRSGVGGRRGRRRGFLRALVNRLRFAVAGFAPVVASPFSAQMAQGSRAAKVVAKTEAGNSARMRMAVSHARANRPRIKAPEASPRRSGVIEFGAGKSNVPEGQRTLDTVLVKREK